jgi:[ribosomal protein S5]-alanine N-acetyltransferase
MQMEKHPTEFPVLETDRLLLRELIENDAADIFEYASDKEITEFVIWETHNSKQDSLEFIKFTQEQFVKKRSIVWGIELKSGKNIVGTISFVNIYSSHKCGEIGYVLSKKNWNKGIVTEAMNAIINYGFETMDLNRIEAHCEEANIGSWKVMEKAGMKFEGVLREKIFLKERFRSMKMYSVLKSEWKGK